MYRCRTGRTGTRLSCLMIICLVLHAHPGAGQTAGQVGAWSGVIPLPEIPIAAALLPNGKVLTWSSFQPTTFETDIGDNPSDTYTSLFDPVSETSETTIVGNPPVDPDKLAQSGKKAIVEGMQDKRVLSDVTHDVELYRIQGNTHADGLIMAYLPKERLLVEVDVYTPPPPNATPPAQPNPASVNLYDNIERLNLAVDQILPLHGRKVPLAELQKWIGKAS
jgi:hypothetical protein